MGYYTECPARIIYETVPLYRQDAVAEERHTCPDCGAVRKLRLVTYNRYFGDKNAVLPRHKPRVSRS